MSSERAALDPTRLVRENVAHDRWIYGCMLVTLAIVSAYPVGIGNPDARLYLAAGRLLLRGELGYGSDPFAYAPHEPQGWASLQWLLGRLGLGPRQLDWVNSGWLAEIVFYVNYSLLGGFGLVLGRVVTVLVIIGLLTRTARHLEVFSVKGEGRLGKSGGESLRPAVAYRPFACWLTFGLLLAGLVLSVRLAVRPDSWGLLFLACLLALLTEPARAGNAHVSSSAGWRRLGQRFLQAGRGRLWWLIPGLFCLWANCDASVVLGLAVLALYWWGQHLQLLWGPDRYARDILLREERQVLTRVFFASALATCINPYHLHVFDPSPLFFPETAALLQRNSPLAARLGVSPFSGALLTRDGGTGLSLAEFCYFAVVAGTVIGWWLGRAHWRWSWFLLQLAGLVLSAYLAKYTAWFVLMALPGAWQSWRNYLVARFGESPQVSRRALLWTQLGRLGLVAALLILVVLTLWPQPSTGTALGYVTRRGWGFALWRDASLEHAARFVAQQHASGRLTGKALHFDWVQAPPYWAEWSSTACWLDLRAGLFTRQAVSDYLEVVQALEKTGTVEGQRERRRWQELLRRYDISYLVVHNDTTVTRVDANKQRVQVPLLPLLLADRDEQGQPTWELLDYMDGITFLLAWTGSPHWPQMKNLRFIPEKRWQYSARNASADELAELDFAGGTRVGTDLEPRRSLQIYLTGEAPAPSLATTAARWLFATLHDWHQRLASPRQQAAGLLLATQWAGWTALLPCEGLVGILARCGTTVEEGWPTLPRVPRLVYQPDAALWLAWRWSRQGILQTPQHPLSWGVCYDIGNFLDSSEAQFSEGMLHESRLLARMFILRQVTRLQPNMANAHLELARRYLERGCDDLALAHAQQFVELPPSRAGDNTWPQKRLQEYLGMSLEQLHQRVADARSQFEPLLPALMQSTTIQARPGEVLARAREIWQARMAGIALNLLQQMMRSLSPRQPEFVETVRLLADIYVQTGDAVSLQRLLDQSWAEAVFGADRLASWQALTAGALGEPLTEAQFRQQIEQRLQQAAVRQFLEGAQEIVLGADLGGAGSFFHGLYLQHQALTRSRERIFNLFAQASADLEAGRLPSARAAFERIINISPREPLAALAQHYLRIIPEH